MSSQISFTKYLVQSDMVNPVYEYDGKPLASYWDQVGKESFHLFQRSPTVSDIYFRELVYRLFDRWMPAKPGARVLKLDMYNEATWTRYGLYFLTKGWETCFVEISLPILLLGTRNIRRSGLAEEASPVQSDFRFLPFRDNTFDLVCSFGSIEHVPEWKQCLLEQMRVAKPSGIVIVGVPNLANLWLRAGFYKIFEITGYLKRFTNPERHFLRGEIECALRDLNFEQIEMDGYHLFPKQLRWLDLWCQQFSGSDLNRFTRRALEPILRAFAKLEERRTFLNSLAEMIVAKAVKPGRSGRE